MKKFQTKKNIVEAQQWFKHGDILHVDYYTTSYELSFDICIKCGKAMREHGEVCLTGPGSVIVCPTDWIIKHADGSMSLCDNASFKERYELME